MSEKRHHVRRISLVRCKDERSMDSAEARLISHYRPAWNVVGNTR